MARKRRFSDEVARRPTLSPSKITTYLACPVKFRWTYVDGRGKWYLRAKSYYSFGATLHSVLQRFHDSEDDGVTTTEEVMAAYDENWIEAGFSSAEEMAEAYGEGKIILERHIEEVKKQPLTSKTLFVERQFRANLGSFDLIGRVDRVDEHEDGALEIVDYKSGREHVSEADIAEDIAMSCYQLLLREKYPDRPVRAKIVALKSAMEASYSLSDGELEEFRADLIQLGEQILSDEYFDLTPRFKRMCPHCDFLTLCRKHEEFAESMEAQLAFE